MSIQVSACRLPCGPSAIPTPKAEKQTSFYLEIKLHKILKLTFVASRHRQSAPVCFFGGKGKSESGNELNSPWKAIEKAAGNFKKDQSVEDMLRQQIQKQEFANDGDNGGNRPGGGGGGGGNGFGGDENEDGSGMWEEFGQVILGTLGFIFLYNYIINSEEINVFTKDTLKFLFTRRKSIRLNRLMNRWKRFFRKMREEEVYEPYELERRILRTTTDYDSPGKYIYLIRRYLNIVDPPVEGPQRPSGSDYDSDPPSDYDY